MKRFEWKVFTVAILWGLGRGVSWAGPCDADVEKFCGDVQAGKGAIAHCISSDLPHFSFECREWIKQTDQSLRRLDEACSDDARTFCRDVRPGYDRVVACLKQNKDKLSNACQKSIGQQ